MFNCRACGNKFHYAKGFIDENEHTYCSLNCTYHSGQSTSCVATFDFERELEKEKRENILYTCGTMQILTARLEPGEKFTGEDGKPVIHATQTEVIFPFSDIVRVTIFRNGEAFPIDISPDGVKNMIVIPPGTPHIVENPGTDAVNFMTFYSPPSLTECS